MRFEYRLLAFQILQPECEQKLCQASEDPRHRDGDLLGSPSFRGVTVESSFLAYMDATQNALAEHTMFLLNIITAFQRYDFIFRIRYLVISPKMVSCR